VTDDPVRRAVREAIDRRLARRRDGQPPRPAPAGHASFALFVLPGDGEGLCLIEPSVACIHCGYCQSLGH